MCYNIRIKSKIGFPEYFKVVTDKYQTEIYLVRSSEGGRLNSMMIFFGKPLTQQEAREWCMDWAGALARQPFEISD